MIILKNLFDIINIYVISVIIINQKLNCRQ